MHLAFNWFVNMLILKANQQLVLLGTEEALSSSSQKKPLLWVAPMQNQHSILAWFGSVLELFHQSYTIPKDEAESQS